jgi:hypothetical protein
MTNKKMTGILALEEIFMSEQNLVTAAQIDPKAYNDNAVNRVPENEYKSTFEIAMVTCGFCICMSGLFTGAAMAAGFTDITRYARTPAAAINSMMIGFAFYLLLMKTVGKNNTGMIGVYVEE